MKNLYLVLLIVSLLNVQNSGQTIIGKVVDEDGNGLQSYNVNLFISPAFYTATTDSLGYFLIKLTEAEEESLPKDYHISNNYPNPFNPRTRIDITLPKPSKIKVEIFNTIGQIVGNKIEREMQAGYNMLDLELNGLPNGVYFARINVNDQYNVIRKMMLLYGSQHLISTANSNTTKFYKAFINSQIDSIVVNAGLIRKKTFTNFPILTGNDLDVGELTMQISCEGMPTITYEGKIYHTVMIGKKCWLKENLNVGSMMLSSVNSSNNNVKEKYCYDNLESNCETYGGLYKWEEAVNYDGTNVVKQGICPSGWHLPQKSEFIELQTLVNNNSAALIDTGVENGLNTSGFSALFSGCYTAGKFSLKNIVTGYFSGVKEYLMKLSKYTSTISFSNPFNYAYSVRCIYGTLPGNIIIRYPADNETYIDINPQITWRKEINSESYWLQIADDSGFNNIIIDKRGIIDTAFTIGPLEYLKHYWIRLRGENNTGLSVNWTSISFTTMPYIIMNVPCPGYETVVYEGRIYHTVQIGTTCWLKENLDVGEMIPANQVQTNNLILEKYCYKNIPANCEEFGGLYSWREAMAYSSSNNTQGICPPGWRLPSLEQINNVILLANHYGISDVLDTGTNETGFSAKFAGYYLNGFSGIGTRIVLWSNYSVVDIISGAYQSYYLSIINSAALSNTVESLYGSVRCTKEIQ